MGRPVPPRNVHLVGSVPLRDAAEVFATVAAALGDRVMRLPDGETGERRDWITWLEPVFAANPALEPSDEVFRLHATAPPRRRYRLKPGRSAADLRFDNLFYADIARRSYDVFRRLRDAGTIRRGTRFQVDLVPAHSVLWLFIAEDLQAVVDPLYNAAVAREIDKLAAAIPRADLAIQFDVASAVFARLARNETGVYGLSKDAMAANFAKILAGLADRVPNGVDLLFHFCYGDSNHRHVVEPTDMGDMAEMANRLTRAIARPIQLIHMPVPRDRDDDAYFAPLANLRLEAETELALGLVHYTDSLAGTRRRLATAERYWKNFAIATECGFGRRPPETIPELLRIHAAAAGIA
ncbi:MAG: hypothetical protein KGL11_02510 [Alphaproteobacteria bacterium]|nr:hypothetical protein [Alphaproteobacteria bacterium]